MQDPAAHGVRLTADATLDAHTSNQGGLPFAFCSVVVPVFNGAATLETLVGELARILPNVVEQYEVILVNDGSSDASWDAITRLCSLFDWVRGIDLARNFGQHNALLCGIRAARGEVV